MAILVLSNCLCDRRLEETLESFEKKFVANLNSYSNASTVLGLRFHSFLYIKGYF